MPPLIRKEHNKILTHRIICAGVILCGFFVILLARLFFLQVIDSQRYRLLSDKNRIETTFCLAARGRILDSKREPLATSMLHYQALLDTRRATNQMWPRIAKEFGLPPISLAQWMMEQKRNILPNHAIVLKDMLSWAELIAAEQASVEANAVSVVQKEVRHYPLAEAACHLVGYVGPAGPQDIERDASLKIFGAVVGRAGAERSHDKRLRGEVGIRQSEVNAMQHVVRVLDETPSRAGEDICLTIDAQLQKAVAHILQPIRSGAAIVIAIPSGEIRALCSRPTFNPEVFTRAIADSDWKTLMTNPDHPFLNRATNGLYGPGSTFKPIVALAALHAGVINENTQYYCPGYHEINGHRFHCWRWRSGGHGYVNVVQALAQSCDVFFYHVAERLKLTPLLEAAHAFGLGEEVCPDIPYAKRGLLPSALSTWIHNSAGAIANLSIGQGRLLTTPLQLATMTASIAANKRITLRLLQDNKAADISSEALPYSAKHMRIVRAGMIAAVRAPLGTAHGIDDPFTPLGGKTGSTQVYRISQEERQRGRLDARAYHLRDHALFIGFAPADKPQFAIVVLVEHGESGGRVAAPLAHAIMQLALHGPKKPTKEEDEVAPPPDR